jgi:hypothetical protein
LADAVAALSAVAAVAVSALTHRYLMKSRLLKFCYVPATSTASSKGIFVVVTNSTNQTNKAGGICL